MMISSTLGLSTYVIEVSFVGFTAMSITKGAVLSPGLTATSTVADMAIVRNKKKFMSALTAAGIFLNRMATAAFSRLHTLGTMSRPANLSGTPNIPKDGLIARAAGMLGIDVGTANGRSQWYRIAKSFNGLGIFQSQVASTLGDGSARLTATGEPRIEHSMTMETKLTRRCYSAKRFGKLVARSLDSTRISGIERK